MELSLQTIFFWFFALLGIAGGLGLILNRNPVYAALSLILNFFSIAGLYLSLQAEFIAVVQIIVYAGAIMVLFLFVIMLLNLSDEEGLKRFDSRRGLAFILGLGFLAELLYATSGLQQTTLAPGYEFGSVDKIGEALFTEYLFPFEIISAILIVALIGAIAVARKWKHTAE
ncbi:MAG: NADH-quinone oxidoreductase subunit J [Bacteroidia bacterium]